MAALRDIPIRRKLMIIIMVTTTAALMTSGSVIVLTDLLLFRGYLQRDLTALARIIADNSTAALAFNDPKTAEEILGALRARPHVVGACIYRLDGSVLAHYPRLKDSPCPPDDNPGGIRFARESVSVSQPIILENRRIGTLRLRYDLGEIPERIRLYGGTVLGVLLVSAVLAFLLSARLRALISTPISQLVYATRSVSETGDYSIRAQRLSGDELGVLVDRFNEMLAGIQSRDDALRKERERFQFLAESMPQKIFTATPQGAVDYFNRQWMEFSGLTFEQLNGWQLTQLLHPDDLESNVEAWRHAVETGEPFLMEHRFRRADGKFRWHLSRAHAMRDTNGNISMWIGSSTEIHEQKEKEEALRRANDDLQQFAYSASHDLQEPIRNVAVYSEIVARRYHGKLDAEGEQFLGFLKEGGSRLARLVNDLLAYTRAGTVELNEAPVDSAVVLNHSLSSLAEALRESGAQVTFDELPQVQMGEAHLQQVFQNLIANAIKYRSTDPPRVHVTATAQPSVWRFSVRDNGIGIESQYKEKIFGVFKRLHHDRTQSGTGIGLAICQRVVQRYGGRIWVESEPGNGSTFYFTIPRAAEASQSSAVANSTD